jgi:hypothetical protein
MTGGLMQLVSYGSQDIYLTGNPQTTFFKFIYKRHTNFAMESIEQSYIGSAKMGRSINATISRNGDLLQSVYLEIEMDNQTITSPYYGYQLIDRIELDIGNQIIESLQGEWLLLWSDLTHNIDKRTMLNNIICNTTNEMYIPLPFYFTLNPGLALPLIALQYHEVRINVYFKNKNDISGGADIDKCSMWCDYIYLDTIERKLFAANSHEYLIEQIQYITTKIPITQQYIKQDLKFINPVKELIWVIQDISNLIYDVNRYEKIDYATIYMNGIERFKKRKGNYFIYLKRYNNHSGSGNTNITQNIHTYSFGLEPENHEPSGTCNFSRINNAELHIDFNSNNILPNTLYRNLNIYARSYNILRIMSGMGGIAYSL